MKCMYNTSMITYKPWVIFVYVYKWTFCAQFELWLHLHTCMQSGAYTATVNYLSRPIPLSLLPSLPSSLPLSLPLPPSLPSSPLSFPLSFPLSLATSSPLPMLQLLIDAINKNYKEEHYCQFASHLLIMTLGFLTRMIKSQTLLEEHVAETMAGQQDTPREGKDVFSCQ